MSKVVDDILQRPEKAARRPPAIDLLASALLYSQVTPDVLLRHSEELSTFVASAAAAHSREHAALGRLSTALHGLLLLHRGACATGVGLAEGVSAHLAQPRAEDVEAALARHAPGGGAGGSCDAPLTQPAGTWQLEAGRSLALRASRAALGARAVRGAGSESGAASLALSGVLLPAGGGGGGASSTLLATARLCDAKAGAEEAQRSASEGGSNGLAPWSCPACTTRNDGSAKVCTMCQTAAPDPEYTARDPRFPGTLTARVEAGAAEGQPWPGPLLHGSFVRAGEAAPVLGVRQRTRARVATSSWRWGKSDSGPAGVDCLCPAPTYAVPPGAALCARLPQTPTDSGDGACAVLEVWARLCATLPSPPSQGGSGAGADVWCTLIAAHGMGVEVCARSGRLRGWAKVGADRVEVAPSSSDAAPLGDDSLRHVAVAATAHALLLTVDGVVVGEAPAHGLLDAAAALGGPLFIGARAPDAAPDAAALSAGTSSPDDAVGALARCAAAALPTGAPPPGTLLCGARATVATEREATDAGGAPGLAAAGAASLFPTGATPTGNRGWWPLAGGLHPGADASGAGAHAVPVPALHADAFDPAAETGGAASTAATVPAVHGRWAEDGCGRRLQACRSAQWNAYGGVSVVEEGAGAGALALEGGALVSRARVAARGAFTARVEGDGSQSTSSVSALVLQAGSAWTLRPWEWAALLDEAGAAGHEEEEGVDSILSPPADGSGSGADGAAVGVSCRPRYGLPEGTGSGPLLAVVLRRLGEGPAALEVVMRSEGRSRVLATAAVRAADPAAVLSVAFDGRRRQLRVWVQSGAEAEAVPDLTMPLDLRRCLRLHRGGAWVGLAGSHGARVRGVDVGGSPDTETLTQAAAEFGRRARQSLGQAASGGASLSPRPPADAPRDWWSSVDRVDTWSEAPAATAREDEQELEAEGREDRPRASQSRSGQGMEEEEEEGEGEEIGGPGAEVPCGENGVYVPADGCAALMDAFATLRAWGEDSAGGNGSGSAGAAPAAATPAAEVAADGGWSCPSCTLHNPASFVACSACATRRPNSTPAAPAPAPAAPVQPSGVWDCGACTIRNAQSATKCCMCGTPRPAPAAQPSGAAAPPNNPEGPKQEKQQQQPDSAVGGEDASAGRDVERGARLTRLLAAACAREDGDASSKDGASWAGLWDTTVGKVVLRDCGPVAAVVLEGTVGPDASADSTAAGGDGSGTGDAPATDKGAAGAATPGPSGAAPSPVAEDAALAAALAASRGGDAGTGAGAPSGGSADVRGPGTARGRSGVVWGFALALPSGRWGVHLSHADWRGKLATACEACVTTLAMGARQEGVQSAAPTLPASPAGAAARAAAAFLRGHEEAVVDGSWRAGCGPGSSNLSAPWLGDGAAAALRRTISGPASSPLLPWAQGAAWAGALSPGVAVLSLRGSGKAMGGRWFRGDRSGQWRARRLPSARTLRTALPGRGPLAPVGLVNMQQGLINVCYQNSVLQALFHAAAFRREVLDGTPVPGSAAAVVRSVFARLLGGQHARATLHGLQPFLGALFEVNRQQDASEFRGFLMNQMEEGVVDRAGSEHGGSTARGMEEEEGDRQVAPASQGASRSAGAALVAEHFGGRVATLQRCLDCGHASQQEEGITDLPLAFPSRFTPIVDVRAVTVERTLGKTPRVDVPAGYERLNEDLNRDRGDAPAVFLCVRRAGSAAAEAAGLPQLDPVTELMVLTADRSAAPPGDRAGYVRLGVDLNANRSPTSTVGHHVYLYLRREPNGSPITALAVVSAEDTVPEGFRKIGTSLSNGTTAPPVHLCYRRDMAVRDVRMRATEPPLWPHPGYSVVDASLAPPGAADGGGGGGPSSGSAWQLWITDAGARPPVTDLCVAAAQDVSSLRQCGWESCEDSPGGGCGATGPHVWTPLGLSLLQRRGEGCPLLDVRVFRAPLRPPRFGNYELLDVVAPPPVPPLSDPRALDAAAGRYVAEERGDLLRNALHLRVTQHTSVVRVEGTASGRKQCRIQGLALLGTRGTWTLVGRWGDANSKERQAVIIRCSPQSQQQPHQQPLQPETQSGAGAVVSNLLGRGAGQPALAYSAVFYDNPSLSPLVSTLTHMGPAPAPEARICELCVVTAHEPTPSGFERLASVEGQPGDLCGGRDTAPFALFLCARRSATEAPVVEVQVVYVGVDGVGEDWRLLLDTPTGASASPNADAPEGSPRVAIAYRRARDDAYVGEHGSFAGWPQQGLQGVAVVRGGSSPPDGFRAITHTPLGMEADLQAGTGGARVRLACRMAGPPPPQFDAACNGLFSATGSWGEITLRAASAPVAGAVVAGHLEGGTTCGGGSVPFQGLLVPEGGDSFRCLAHATAASRQYAMALEWTLDGAQAEGRGTLVRGIAHQSVTLVRDNFLQIGFARDRRTRWTGGREVFSDRRSDNSVETLLRSAFAPTVMTGSERVEGGGCGRRTSASRETALTQPPRHLALTLKRIHYDTRRGALVKRLTDAAVPVRVALPVMSTAGDAGMADAGRADADVAPPRRGALYGLFALVVHSGTSASSGHYYCFARDSAAPDLSRADSEWAPWCRLNDAGVQRLPWANVARELAAAPSDTAYILLYKCLRLGDADALGVDPSVPTEVTSPAPADGPSAAPAAAGGADAGAAAEGDEEAMIQRAIALSMQEGAQTEEKEGEGSAKDGEASGGALGGVGTPLLRQQSWGHAAEGSPLVQLLRENGVRTPAGEAALAEEAASAQSYVKHQVAEAIGCGAVMDLCGRSLAPRSVTRR